MQDRPLDGNYTIDRFEGNLAVLLYRPNEDQELILPRNMLPNEVGEGSILSIKTKDGIIETITYLAHETLLVRDRNRQLLQSLIQKDPSI
jgi:hypothetical protein